MNILTVIFRVLHNGVSGAKRMHLSSTAPKTLAPSRLYPTLLLIVLLLASVSGCAPKGQAVSTPSPVSSATPQPAAPTAVMPTLTAETSVPAAWSTHSNAQYRYSLSYPPEMEVSGNGDYSWTLRMKSTNPEEVARNFIYLSVIPAGFQSSGGDIYNYSTEGTDLLLNLQVGESKSVHKDLNTGFTYTRTPDVILSGQTATRYENNEPWEFPRGTKEIRHYLKTGTYTYLLGGYVDITGSDQPGVITEEAFNQIVATFRITP